MRRIESVRPFWYPAQSSKNTDIYLLKASKETCVGIAPNQHLMGGVAMATAVEVAEIVTKRPLLWATMQYVSYCRLGDIIEFEVTVQNSGRNIDHVNVDCRVDGQTIQLMNAALGQRSGFEIRQFVQMPEVISPDDLPEKHDEGESDPTGLLAHFERRNAFENEAMGVEHMWIRPTSNIPINAALLALTSDFILGAHSATRGGASLDNTFRMFSNQSTEWILSCTQMVGFADGAAHCNQVQYAQDGTLLSISSQTGLIPRQRGD